MAQRPVCASISRSSIVHRRCESFKHKKCILERKVFASIATIVGQKESGSCPAVVVEGVEVCGGRVRCVGVVKVCGTVLVMGQ